MTAARPRSGSPEDLLRSAGDELYRCLRMRTTVPPLTERFPGVTIEDAYRISKRMLERRLADGERVVGKKIGVTSKVVQNALGVHQPDFGWLTDWMWCRARAGENVIEVPIGNTLIQPRAEGEIAFRLGRDLVGPGVTEADVVDATECAMTCCEIVDSRIHDWKIKIEDTVADNASSGMFAIGLDEVDARRLDLPSLHMRVEKNGAPLSEGYGSAALGSPLTSVAWLANTLGGFGVPLRAGEIVLSGSLVPLEPVRVGDEMRFGAAGIGDLRVRFV